MPTFYFHIRDAGSLIEDLEGSALPDLAVACIEARACARDLLIELIKAGQPLNGQCVEIADDTGRIIASVPLKSVLA